MASYSHLSDPFYAGDPPDVRILKDENRKAKKLHECDTCPRSIEPGTVYRYIVVLTDGEFETHKTHGGCYE